MGTSSAVDDYLAALAEVPRAALEQLRATIRAAAPEATETIAYQMPAFRDHGRFLVSYAAYKDHCSLFPASQAVRDALGDELKPYITGEGHDQLQGRAAHSRFSRDEDRQDTALGDRGAEPSLSVSVPRSLRAPMDGSAAPHRRRTWFRWPRRPCHRTQRPRRRPR